ncbi:MAG TPA: hypothetical protein VFQ34_15080 [Nitrospiraceae bacterium]|jgi:hypothetical protein|nr:hypothetical protein [Nitrospiraceae bacterium]
MQKFLLLTGLWVLPLLLLTSSTLVHAGTFWTEDFEHGLANWHLYDGAGPGNIEIVSNEAHSGKHSLRMHYDDLDTGVGPFMDHHSQHTTNMYIRAWVKWGPGFQIAPAFTKLVYAPRGDSNTGPGCLIDLNPGLGGGISFICQSVPNDGQNTDDFMHDVPRAELSEEWHCVEWRVYNGTVGKADGVVQMWWDDELVFQRRKIHFLVQPADYYIVRMYRERGMGDIYWDDFSVGDSRQGCGNGPPPPTETDEPPAQIKNVTVTPGKR